MEVMVLFWVLQCLLNIVLVGIAVSYVIQRRRLILLENQLRFALERLQYSAREDEITAATEAINTPLGSAMSTLSERKASSFGSDPDVTSLSSAGRYSLAQKLLGEGRSLAEVGKRTGISETELALLKKFAASPVSKNYEAH
jgi:hypothetical protein